MKIYLIGMPGSGKTTLGKQVAADRMITFVDLDHEIEQHEGRSIPEIFANHGEEHFRKIESTLLKKWSSNEEDFIMATGGGAPCFYNGIEIINQSGVSIFFDVEVNQLLSRVEKKTDRPLLQMDDRGELKNKIEQLRQQRLSCYQQAKITIQNPTLPMVLEKLNIKK